MIKIVRVYQRVFSSALVILFGRGCRFRPTCSEYAVQAIEKYGILKGSLKTIKRVVKCNPLSKPKFDPVK